MSAASALDIERHPRITCAALRRTKCRAASRPSPTLAPVMRITWDVKSWVGTGSLAKSWDLRKETRKPGGLV